jgi:hypothetical protein
MTELVNPHGNHANSGRRRAHRGPGDKKRNRNGSDPQYPFLTGFLSILKGCFLFHCQGDRLQNRSQREVFLEDNSAPSALRGLRFVIELTLRALHASRSHKGLPKNVAITSPFFLNPSDARNRQRTRQAPAKLQHAANQQHRTFCVTGMSEKRTIKRREQTVS